MENPKVSIIMPTYNRAYVLWKAIQSIQFQEYPHWKLIIVDDHSTDDTEKLIREFRSDSRIICIKNDDKTHSPAGARSKGYDFIEGNYVAYLDSDNTASTDWLSTVIQLFSEDKKAKFIYTGQNFQTLLLENGVYKTLIQRSGLEEHPTTESLWSHTFDGDPNGLIHTADALDKINGWDEDLSLYEDYDYSLQLAQAYPKGIRYLPIALINYTRLYGEKGICNGATYKSIVKNLIYLKEKYKDNPNWTKQTWPDKLIKKYTKYDNAGISPITRIKSKYAK